jgi:hypothetical protein
MPTGSPGWRGGCHSLLRLQRVVRVKLSDSRPADRRDTACQAERVHAAVLRTMSTAPFAIAGMGDVLRHRRR